MEKLQKIVEKVSQEYNPKTIFLYGSRAKGGFLEESDYEVGVVSEKDKKVSSSVLQLLTKGTNIRIYSFIYEDLLEGIPQTPFQNNFYMYELHFSSKVLFGENIFITLSKPRITLINLLQEVRFCIGRCVSGLLEFREGNIFLAKESVYKSCLYGVRCLEICQLNKFGFSYDEIFNFKSELDFIDNNEIISKSFQMRVGNFELDIKNIYDTLTLLGEIEKYLVSIFEKEGNKEFLI